MGSLSGAPSIGAALWPAVAALTLFWGLCWGSFLNVLIYRLPWGMSVVSPGSACPSCARSIKPWENIPVLSWIFLRGRCRGCAVEISPRYPLVELLAGVWSLVLAWLTLRPALLSPVGEALLVSDPWAQLGTPLGLWLWYQLFVYGLIVLTFIDLDYTYLPDEITIPGLWIALLGAGFLEPISLLTQLIGAAAGYATIWLLRGIGWLLFRREAMGMGDAKLLAFIGAFIGWEGLPLILFLSAAQGVLAAFLGLLYQRLTGRADGLTMSSEELDERFGEESPEGVRSHLVIPYGPFLALAALEVFVVGDGALSLLILGL